MCSHEHSHPEADPEGYWDFYDRSAVAELAADGGEGEAARQARPAAAAPYLESVRKDCDGESARYELVRCGCRSWFCEDCCVGRGLALRDRLLPILASFTGLLMWTFTVDPTLFPSPAAAYQYVRDKRCISNLMRRLKERGYLHSGRWFCVVEWQRETMMAHFHVLVDATSIPFEVVRDLWNRFRPASAGSVQGDRPGFGSVRFSAPKFADAMHAARYACKYLIKYPEHRYPDWVMDSTGEVHRYSTSRGFWGADRAADVAKDPEACEEADGDEEGLDELEAPEAVRKPIRLRVALCGLSSVVVRVREQLDEPTGELVQRRPFVAVVDVPLVVAADALGRAVTAETRRMELSGSEVAILRQRFSRSAGAATSDRASASEWLEASNWDRP